jgi:hypothetical protein
LAMQTLSTYRKVGAFLYCVKWPDRQLTDRPPTSGLRPKILSDQSAAL